MKTITYYILIATLLAGASCSAFGATSGSINNTYLYDYSQPPIFQPSLAGEFTSLSNSSTTVLANPAGIMKINTLEAVLGTSGIASNPIVSRSNTIYMNDRVENAGDMPGDAKASVAIRFTADPAASTPEARPISLLDEYSKGGGINYFGLTFRVTDGLAFAFTRQRPTALSFNLNANLPMMVDVTADLRGFRQVDGGNGLAIRSDGRADIIWNDVTIETSSVPLYAGFLDQSTKETNWLDLKVNNTVVNQQSVIVSSAFKTGPVNWGINVIPMTYNVNFDNVGIIRADQNNGNLRFMIPDPSFGSSEEAIYWITFESGTAGGYLQQEMTTHPAATLELGGFVSAGNYSGSTLRLDLGAMWEPNEYLSFGFMYENFNQAKLVLSGTDIVHYAQHWISSESQMSTLETVWDPFLSSPTHEASIEKYIMLGNTLTPIVLPSKITLGMALKKPLILAVDFEKWQNDVMINLDPGSTEGHNTATLNNVAFLKAGMESQLLFLPLLFRGSMTMLLKPTTDDPDLQKSFDDLFKTIPVLPIQGDMYFSMKIMKGELGFGGGGGGLPLTMAMAADMSKIAKIFFWSVYYAEESWQVSYQMTTDPIMTVMKSDLSKTDITMEDIKFANTSTLNIGFKF